MTELPIIFSAPMVRAILDGRKTMTRRVLKVPHNNPLGVWEATTVGGPGVYTGDGQPYSERAVIWHTRAGTVIVPPYAVGDLLWVKETWGVGTRPCPIHGWRDGIEYRADDTGEGGPLHAVDADLSEIKSGWRSSRFMPRWASRITLEVTGVRVERLQDISEDDAKAEGVTLPAPGDILPDPHRFCFIGLWERLHGPGAWEANPWVAAISFKREEKANG